MYKEKNSFTYLYLLILFSGCNSIFSFGFDYFELAHFNKNGSGKFEIIFSMDRARRVIALGEQMVPEHTELVRLFLDDTYAEAVKRLSTVPGISNIAHNYNQDRLHFGLSFRFNSIRALNKAMGQMVKTDKPGITYFQFNERKFVRSYTTNKIGQLLDIYKKNDDSLVKSFDLSFFFRNMRYVIQYSFGSEIRKVSNPLARISQNRKRVTIIGNMFDAHDKDLLTTNQILFKTFLPSQQKIKSLTNSK